MRGLLVAVPSVVILVGGPARGGDLGVIEVEVSSLRGPAGQVICALFATSDGFPLESGRAERRVVGTRTGDRGRCRFEGVPPGTYAVAVGHDLDGNRLVDTDLLGRPTEAWAVSNNVPPSTFSAPSFEDARFEFDGSRLALELSLRDGPD